MSKVIFAEQANLLRQYFSDTFLGVRETDNDSLRIDIEVYLNDEPLQKQAARLNKKQVENLVSKLNDWLEDNANS